MHRLVAALFALTLATGLAGCTQASEEFRDLTEFVDGMAVDSDMGAFRVVISSADGAIGVGRNDLTVRLGFHDPDDPEAEGRGIPGAELHLDAWMPGTDMQMNTAPTIAYLGDGAYAIDNVVLDRPGIWNVDLEIEVGSGMYETVSLAFDVAVLDFRENE